MCNVSLAIEPSCIPSLIAEDSSPIVGRSIAPDPIAWSIGDASSIIPDPSSIIPSDPFPAPPQAASEPASSKANTVFVLILILG